MMANFENKRLKIELTEECITESIVYIFTVEIKDFDTPKINIEYDRESNIILRTWIENDKCVNIPKSHVVYKMFSLVEYEITEIMKFMVKHI